MCIEDERSTEQSQGPSCRICSRGGDDTGYRKGERWVDFGKRFPWDEEEVCLDFEDFCWFRHGGNGFELDMIGLARFKLSDSGRS